MKKDYFKPTMRVVEMKHKCQILAGSDNQISSVHTNMSGDDDFEFVGGGKEPGR